MKQERAKRILRLLGWGTSQAAREFNRVTGKSYSRQHVNAQLNGTRGVSESLALFLRLRIRISQLERRAGADLPGRIQAILASGDQAVIARLERRIFLSEGDLRSGDARRGRLAGRTAGPPAELPHEDGEDV